MALPLKAKKKAQIRNQYKLVPHLPETQNGKAKKTHKETSHTKGEHNATRNKQDIIIKVRKKGKDLESIQIKHHT